MLQVAINPAYQKMELEYSLKKVGVRCLVIPSSFKSHDYYNTMEEIVPELKKSSPKELHSENLPDLKVVVIMDDQKKP